MNVYAMLAFEKNLRGFPVCAWVGKCWMVSCGYTCFPTLMGSLPFLWSIFMGASFLQQPWVLWVADSCRHICVHYFMRHWNPWGEESRGLRFICDKPHVRAPSWNSLLFSNRIYYIFQTVHVYHTFPGMALFTDGLNKFFCLFSEFAWFVVKKLVPI